MGFPPAPTSGHITFKFSFSSFHVTYFIRPRQTSAPRRTLELEPALPRKEIVVTTNAQMKANRNNAKKSTGPRTEEGKSRSAKNALKHGLLARDTVLPGEDPADFDRQLSSLEEDIQPANSLEFELVRQIADAQWRMRRLTRLETGFLAAAVAEKRCLTEKYRPENLRPGYDGETLLLGSAMLDRTQVLVHLARYDGHLSRRFFRAVKQLSDLRRDERKAHEARSSSGSYASTDPYHGRYVPAQAPPPIDTPSPTAGRIGFRLSSDSPPLRSRARKQAVSSKALPQTQTTKQTQSRRTPMKSTADRQLTSGRAADGEQALVGWSANRSLTVAAPADGSRVLLSRAREQAVSPKPVSRIQTTKQTQSRRTLIESMTYNDGPCGADLPFENRRQRDGQKGRTAASPGRRYGGGGDITPQSAGSAHRVRR